jgi:hypothetical protein
MNIYQKLIEVRKEVPYLQKESQGAQYKYVGSSQVLANVKKKMDELQLLLIPGVVAHKVTESAVDFFDKETDHVTKRTTTYFTELDMTMTWVNAENPEETIVSPWYGQGVDIAGEKGVGKALTYAEKYFMLKFFNIPTDKDDPDSFQKKYENDGDAAGLLAPLGESKIDSVKIQTLQAMLRKTNTDEKILMKYYGVDDEDVKNVTISVFSLAMAALQKKLEKQHEKPKEEPII